MRIFIIDRPEKEHYVRGHKQLLAHLADLIYIEDVRYL